MSTFSERMQEPGSKEWHFSVTCWGNILTGAQRRAALKKFKNDSRRLTAHAILPLMYTDEELEALYAKYLVEKE